MQIKKHSTENKNMIVKTSFTPSTNKFSLFKGSTELWRLKIEKHKQQKKNYDFK